MGRKRKTGIQLIRKERRRQKRKGWSADHDDQHTDGALAVVAAQLLVHATDERVSTVHHLPDGFGLIAKYPYHGKHLRQLAIAGALVAAEIDRVLRVKKGNDDDESK